MEIIGFALCLENSDSDDLELNKVYPIVEPEANDSDAYLRVVVESEGDYLYPKEMFEIVAIPLQGPATRYSKYSDIDKKRGCLKS